jgi:hypothetical protein
VNSNEIKNVEMVSSGAPIEHVLYRACEWLQQIAYQLAVMNERNALPSREESLAEADAVAAAVQSAMKPFVETPRFTSCIHYPMGPEECGVCFFHRIRS